MFKGYGSSSNAPASVLQRLFTPGLSRASLNWQQEHRVALKMGLRMQRLDDVFVPNILKEGCRNSDDWMTPTHANLPE